MKNNNNNGEERTGKSLLTLATQIRDNELVRLWRERDRQIRQTSELEEGLIVKIYRIE